MFAPRRHSSAFLLALLLTGLAAASVAPPLSAQTEEEQYAPTYITARVFQARAKKSGNPDITDQLFRLRTPGANDDAKWLAQLQKAYPGFDLALLQTHALRVFKMPKPAVVYLGKRNAPHVEMQVFGAFSEGDGKTLGTTLITSVEYHMPGHPRPTSMAYQGTEVQTGMTYFFTHPSLNLKKSDYVNFVRGGGDPRAFEADDIYLIVALSVEPDKPAPYAFDVKTSAQLQAGATKKAEPQWPEELKQLNSKGSVQVRVELSGEGRVAQASVLSSTLPEANAAALAAARQWEFSASALAGKPTPASAVLTFDFAPAPPKAETPGPPKPTASVNR